jgi:hypothetical protein
VPFGKKEKKQIKKPNYYKYSFSPSPFPVPYFLNNYLFNPPNFGRISKIQQFNESVCSAAPHCGFLANLCFQTRCLP